MNLAVTIVIVAIVAILVFITRRRFGILAVATILGYYASAYLSRFVANFLLIYFDVRIAGLNSGSIAILMIMLAFLAIGLISRFHLHDKISHILTVLAVAFLWLVLLTKMINWGVDSPAFLQDIYVYIFVNSSSILSIAMVLALLDLAFFGSGGHAKSHKKS